MSNREKGAILMVALWILAILTLLAVGIGYQMSLELKATSHHRDRFRALTLAETGFNHALEILEKDKNGFDSLNESWATGLDEGKPLFGPQKIDPENPLHGTWAVGYEKPDDSGAPQISYAVTDEERKINLNRATTEQLKLIADQKGLIAANPDIVDAIRFWRGDRDFVPPVMPREGWYVTQKPKSAAFEHLEELFLIVGVTDEMFAKVSDLVTVYGDGTVNMNTASGEVLNILLQAEQVLPGPAASLTNTIISFRARDDGIFEVLGDIQGQLELDPLSEEGKAWAALLDTNPKIPDVKSDHFRIQAIGSVAQGNVERRIEAVVKMGVESEIVSYRER